MTLNFTRLIGQVISINEDGPTSDIGNGPQQNAVVQIELRRNGKPFIKDFLIERGLRSKLQKRLTIGEDAELLICTPPEGKPHILHPWTTDIDVMCLRRRYEALQKQDA